MTTRTATPLVSTRDAGEYIATRRTFNTHGSLSGGYMNAGIGRLPENRHTSFYRAIDADDFYAVYSYGTPIAWYSHGTWVVPTVKYSATTSRHQGIVKRAVA